MNAKTNPINDAGATAGHNIATINATIAEGFKARLKLENQIDALKAKYVQPLQDERKELNRKLKADTDIHSKDLDLNFKFWKRQEEAKKMDDEAEGNAVLDGLRTAFGALAAEGMVNFADILDGKQPAPKGAQSDAQDNEEESQDAAA